MNNQLKFGTTILTFYPVLSVVDLCVWNEQSITIRSKLNNCFFCHSDKYLAIIVSNITQRDCFLRIIE